MNDTSDDRSHGGSLCLRGARAYPNSTGPIASDDPGDTAIDVLVEHGRIRAVGPDLDAHGVPELDARGRIVIPGLMDVHVHFRDPGLAHKEGWDRGSAGALHGGVTSVVEVQNNRPLSTSVAAMQERLAHVARSSRVDFGLLPNLLPVSLPELDGLAALGPALKCFLGGSTGLGGQTDRDTIRQLFDAAARAGRMIVAHCEDEDLLRAGAKAHPDATAREHHIVRSTEAEVRSIETSIELVRETGAELHVFHISSAAGVECVRSARAEGLPVSASTAPHYLLLSCLDAERLGNLLRVNPSVKTPADSEGILAGLRDGTVAAIGTDHAPHPLKDKLRTYKKAPSGMPSVDLLWPLTWELVRRELLSPEIALASVTWRAAESLHLPFKGRLAPGYDGDLVLFDPESEREVEGCSLPSTSKWSAYEGFALAGWPEVVVRRGELVFEHGAVTGTAGGRALALEAPRPRQPAG